jgi:aminopeptidase N
MPHKQTFILIFCLLVSGFATAQRLPQGVTPEHYSLTFAPDLAKATFSGEEFILVQVQKPGATITLNAVELALQEATVIQGEKTQTAQVQLAPAREQAVLTVANALEVGPATVHIKFTGTLNDQLRGFYRARTALRSYAVTQFEATDARRAFPSFDEPAFKASFDITLVVDNGDTAISNGHILSDDPGPEPGKHTLKFSTTPKMSTYLVAMAVGDFVCNVSAEDNVPIRVCGTPDKKALGVAALRYAKENLKFYNQYYATPYPFGKLDIVGVPDFEAGAMENTAAIFYRESDLFIDDSNSSVSAHSNVFVVLSHEMAHQWFGDLVTMKWWDNLWLNEGFATWMELKPAQTLHPEWNAHLGAVTATDQALALDALENTHPIRARAETPDEITQMFDPISYQKGGAVLRMVERYLSPDVFRRGVNAYVKKFSYGNATAEDFWKALAEASGRPVDKIMPTFVEQAGAPVISVKLSCTTPPPEPKAPRGRRSRRRVLKPAEPKTEITLEQSRFWTDPGGRAASAPWMVPVCIRTSTARPFCQVVSQKKQVIPATGCSPWAFVNAGATGYYRTEYDAASLQQLLAVAGTELTSAERISLLSDAAALVGSRPDSMGRFLDLVTVLSPESTSAEVDIYAPILRRIHDYLLTDADKSAYQAWVQATFRPVLAKLGWSPLPGEKDDLRTVRSDMIAILGELGEDPEVLQHATQLAHQYLKNPRSVDASIAADVLTVAALNGDAALYQELETLRHDPAVTPEQRVNVGRAAGNFLDAAITQKWLETIVKDTPNQDSAALLSRVLRHVPVQKAAWEWAKEHWSEVEAKFTTASGAAVVEATRSFCEAPLRDDARQFFAAHKVGASERTLKQAQEVSGVCIKQRAGLQQEVAAWLQQHGGDKAAAR